uniref:Uncharacterized protein n=1 Tax=Actinobacteria phage HS02 TaxID=3056388 RepID=A0AA50AC94_9VIRU|nr:MAG: hypothetical protein [Actinobacteria phage HS02]
MRGLAVGCVGALYSPPMRKAPCSRSARGFLNPFLSTSSPQQGGHDEAYH